MARRERAISDAPGDAVDAAESPTGGSLAERPPRSRGVAWLGFFALLVLGGLFAHTALTKKPVNVPHGLLGLRFGMTEAEVKKLLPNLAPNPAGKLALETTVFEAPAHCTLGFSSDELTSVLCAVDEVVARDDHHRVKQRIVATIRQLYGDESQWTPGQREQWAWRSSRAELVVVSEGDALRVENVRLGR